jgi:myosin heavy subunit
VKVASFLITSDSKFFEGMSKSVEREFFATAYDYFCEEYGKENIAYAMVHKDEKTPHMHVGFVPITEDGRLSAKDFFGKKQQLVMLQDKFHKHMLDAGFDLERGVSSDRKHLETSKFKAETYAKMEREAKEKYEKTMSQLNEIQDRVEDVEKIDAKKVLNTRILKDSDFQTLMGLAKVGAKNQIQVENLQQELEKSQKEVVLLQSENQNDQDKLRALYQGIQKENEEIKTNFGNLVNEKAEEIALEKLRNSDSARKVQELIEKHNGLAKKYNEMAKTNQKTIKELSYERDNFRIENKVLKNENRELNVEKTLHSKEISSLKSTIENLRNELESVKNRVSLLLNAQLDRIKSFLMVRRVNDLVIRDLEQKRPEYTGEALEKFAEKEQNRKQQRDEIEINR